MTNLVRDENRIAALGGESTVSRVILPAKINPTTNRLLTETNIVNSSGIVINPATSDNQTNGSQKTQIVDSNNKTIVPTTPTDIQLSELIPVLRSLITAIANPSYVDKSANQMRAQITGSLTTLTTCTTVTNLTNIGSFPADHLQRMNNMTAWATNIRSLIT